MQSEQFKSRNYTQFKSLLFSLMLAIPALLPLSIYFQAYWLVPVVVFVFVPLLDALCGQDASNPYLSYPRIFKTSPFFYWLPHAYVALWFPCLLLGIHHYATAELKASDQIFLLWALGTITAFATSCAHELRHRQGRLDYAVTNFIMSACGYNSFVHVHFHHHAHVGSYAMGTVPEKGESIYRFIPRNIIYSVRNALRIEKQRRSRKSLSLLHDRVLHQYACTFLLGTLITAAWGIKGLVASAFQALVAVASVELIQYFQHYGLVRKDGKSIRHLYSWNSNFLITNAITLNITRHSDHHDNMRIPYEHLRNHPHGPQLPAGYFALAWLAAVPPLWFKVIDKRVDAYLGADLLHVQKEECSAAVKAQ